MRWDAQVCPQCGGEFDVDYAEVLLVCLRCGCKERLPTAPRLHAETKASGVGTRRTRHRAAGPAHALGLVEVGLQSRRLIEAVCAPQGYQVLTVSGGRDAIGQDQQGWRVDLLVVEADRAGLAVRLARELRRRFPTAPVAVVLTSWSEAEKEADGAAEFILHAPLRRAEVARMLQVMEHYGGWLPAPLLASKYRAGLAS